MLPRKIAHLDLKGLQRTSSLLFEHLEMLGAMGYDGLLVEYEDRFPYREAEFATEPEEVWSVAFHRAFLERAKECGLQVIPLQQTLAHLEYIQRWDRYRDFGIVNPTSGEPIESTTLHLGKTTAREWMKALVHEMIEAHPDSHYIHLGMDESWSLGVYARELGVDPLALFLDWLEELCTLCREQGRTPLIWSDMLEDHLAPSQLERLKALRDEVVLVVWDYTATAPTSALVRFAGWRTSRCWANEPGNPEGAHLRTHHLWMEDWPAEIAMLAAPYRADERRMQSLFQAAVWKGMGFRVLGAAGIAMMMEGALLPLTHRRMANLDRWQAAIAEWELDGLIVTAWARGGTFHPPTVIPDLQLALWEYAAGGTANVAFRGIPRKELYDLLAAVGRYAEGALSLNAVVKKLEGVAASLDSHHNEWESLRLLIETFSVKAQAEGFIEAARSSRYANRQTRVEWGYRLSQCAPLMERYKALRERAIHHLGARYSGAALHEWLALVFDVPLRDLAEAERQIAKLLAESNQRFS